MSDVRATPSKPPDYMPCRSRVATWCAIRVGGGTDVRYELRYTALGGGFWTVVDTQESCAVASFKTRTAAQRRANILNGEVTSLGG